VSLPGAIGTLALRLTVIVCTSASNLVLSGQDVDGGLRLREGQRMAGERVAWVSELS
jgi:hypothetical protein